MSGTRGIFDGTVENMHLHWKYRELVKIIVKRKNFAQVKHIAISLEAESGGVLVSVDRVPKGYAIVVYRGKNYQRPSAIRPNNLLTKRQALARSIELQRHEVLLADAKILAFNGTSQPKIIPLSCFHLTLFPIFAGIKVSYLRLRRKD